MTPRMVTAPRGSVEPGYEPVVEAFARNLAERRDGGCAFAAAVNGRLVVDLWGGEADERDGAPWTRDTAAVVFSGTKGIVATALLLLVARGRLSLADPVADHWPEFAANGKGAITVRQLGSHCAGLPGLERPLGRADLQDPAAIAAHLAGQAPLTEVGRPCYHALAYGWLVGELIRRVDGRTPGRMILEEFARPLDLDLRLGLDPTDPMAVRLAHLRAAPDYRLSAYAVAEPDPRLDLIYPLAGVGDEAWNDPGVLAAEVPAAGAVATARAMALLYGRLVASRSPLLPADVLAQGIEPAGVGDDQVTGRPLRFGPTGYELAGTPSELGPAADAFGHTGAGGSSHGAWPSLATGFSYVTAELRREESDSRAATLLAALHEAVPGG